MREILFRGKRLYNGDWVEGYLYEHEPPLVGIVSEKDEPEASKWFIARTGFADWNMPRPVELVEVDPSTVGQYTGLKDKNGERIFDGDIIAVPFEEDRSPWEENCIYYENGKVYFDEIRFGWYVKFKCDELTLWEYDDCGVTIIGSIHDNPEFMKEGADNG